MYRGYFDGATRASKQAVKGRGESVAAYVIYSPAGEVVWEESFSLSVCNNHEAEYQGLIQLLKRVIVLNFQDIHIFGDSLVIAEHWQGKKKLDTASYLFPLHEEAEALKGQIPHCLLQWIPRHKNERANQLCLDQFAKGRK